MNLESLPLNLLKSNKAGERKKGAERLLELLSDNDDVCHILASNSVQKGKSGENNITWTALFCDVVGYFTKETEKLTISQTGSAAKNFSLTVVTKVFQKGTSHRPWISWGRIFDFITGNLSHEIHATVYGSALMSMLQTFLSIDLYASVIEEHCWIDLTKLLLKLYGAHNIPPFMVLQCINLCVQEGSNHPTVIATIRSDVLKFYENLFSENRVGSRSNLCIIIRGITALCRRNALEFRVILCKFGEFLIPKILYTTNNTPEEEVAIVELLLVQLQLHSPCDINTTNPAFHADDPRKWTEILKTIYSFCLEALEDIALKKNVHFHKELQVSDKLYLLAAKATKQICDGQSDEHSSSGDEDDPNPTKKSMRYRSFYNVLNEVCSRMTPGESQIVWVNYLTAVLTQFPHLVDNRLNFSSLFTMGYHFMKSSYVARREIYVFFLCLLNTEKYLMEVDIMKTRSKCWENIWDMTIRSLSVCEFKTEALELLRKLLIEVQPPNVHSLLLLYSSGAIPVTSGSLNLLAEYLSRCSLPLFIGSSSDGNISGMELDVEVGSTSCPRSALIRWLMNSSSEKNNFNTEEHELGLGHEPLISTIMCSLLVRQTHNLIAAERFCCRANFGLRLKIPSELSQFETMHEDFENFLLKGCFVTLSIPNEEALKSALKESQAEVLNLSLIPTLTGRLIEALVEDYEKLPVIDHKQPDFLKKFIKLNFRVALYLNAINVLEKHTISATSAEDLSFRTSLEKLFDKALSKSMETATDFITKGKNKSALEVQELISVMRNNLKSSHLSEKVKIMLSQRFPQQMQELLKKAYRSNLVRYIERAANNPNDTLMFGSADILDRFLSSGDDAGGLSECRKIELAALESLGCLIDYGIICDHRVDLFTDILKDCINESYNSNIPFIFEFGSELITRLIVPLNAGVEREYTGVLTLVTNLLQKMCKGFYQIPQCSARLWELFSDITELTARDTDVNKKNLMILVGSFTGFMKTKNPYGSNILVCQAGFKALNEIAKNDPEMVWSVFPPKTGAEIWVLNETYEFLNNPSNQIRLFSAETISRTYECAAPPCSAEPIYSNAILSRPLSRDAYFEKICQFLLKTFQIPSGLSVDERTEESINRTSIALSCLTRLVFAYPYIQKKSLFSFLQLVKVKGIEISLSNRALMYASPSASKTMCCHVSFLIHMWLTSHYSIDDFPFQFFGCETMGAFYTLFRTEIGVEFFQNNDTEGLKKFASSFEMQPIELIKECYGMLMARTVPGVAVYNCTNQSTDHRDITKLQEIQKRLSAFLGGKNPSDTLMMTRLEEVVMQFVSLVFDPSIASTWGCPKVYLPEPSSPYYDEDSVDTGLKFLKEASSRKDWAPIGYLATSNPKAIYDTMLTLITRVHNAHDVFEKFWRLHQFSYFVRQLLKEQPPIFNTMKEYVCQFVIYGYIRLLNSETGEEEYSKYLREALVFLISQLVMNLTLTYKDEMKHHYYNVVNNLVVTAVKYPDLLEAVKKPLDLLLLRYTDDFADCIVSLDPFPTNKIPDFEKYKEVYHHVKYGPGPRPGSGKADWPLFKELDSCLQDIVEGGGTWTLERLAWVRELLSAKKRDLEKLVKNLEGKRFSDHCHSDVLHSLIQTLIKVIKNGVDDQAVLEAARCLGEIGPVDLSVLVLPKKPKQNTVKGIIHSKLHPVLDTLAKYLKSDDINLMTTSAQVLKSLCPLAEISEMITKELNKTRTDLILKPFKVAQGSLKPVPVAKVYANLVETKLGLNEMNEFVDYKTWITQLTCGLIECFKNEDSSVIALLLPVCKIKVEFCQEILPFIFFSLLLACKTNPLVRKTVSGYFRNFFLKCVNHLSNITENSRSFTPVPSTNNQVSIYANKLALRSLLDVIQYLRLHPIPQEYKGSSKLTPWHSNFWLDINYFDLAKAAQHCGAYLTSILFTEIAVTELEFGASSHVEDTAQEDMDSFYSQGAVLLPRSIRVDTHEKLLLKAYTSIGEPDAVYGCGSARFSEGIMNISHLQQRMQFFRVLSACDGNAVDSESPVASGVCGSLKDLALYNTLWTYLQGIEAEHKVLDHDLAEIQYECGWRLSKWDLHCDKATYLKDGSFFENSKSHGMLQRFVYESVQTGLTKDTVNHMESVQRGYKSVSKNLRHASIESSENLYGFLSQFQMMRLVEDFFQEEAIKGGALGVEEFLTKWKYHDRCIFADFKFSESILSLKSGLLHSYGQRNRKINLESEYEESMLELLAKARDYGRLEFAENCANCISSTSERSLRKDLEIAKNHWARGDQDIARHMLSKLTKKANPDGSGGFGNEMYPNLLLLYGQWLSESMSERPSIILDRYLLKSTQIFEKRGSAGQAEGAKAHFILAKYADQQYQNVVKYMKSELYSEKVANLEKAKHDMASVASANADIEIRRSLLVLKKQSTIDQDELETVVEEKKKFLLLALRHYLRGLKDSNDQDLQVFRAVALWLENAESSCDVKFSKQVNDIVSTECLPSYKYITVLHQLSARLSLGTTIANNSLMIENLTNILTKCAHQHPFHTLPVLLTQALMYEDQNVQIKGKAAPKKNQHTEDRVKAASKLVDSLKRHASLGPVTNKMTCLWLALIKLANIHEKGNNTSPSVLIPNDLQIKRLTGLNIVPVPTVTLPVSPSKDYNELVGIFSFDPTYALVGGINSPKKIGCIGTNGVKYPMLLKGQDDLRQDAVMQQVFSVMNKLLNNEPKTKGRRLHVRTYKVVPLSQRTGVLEWCENTQTFGDYLTVDIDGAHQKYRPGDFNPLECRRKMAEVKDCGDNDRKYGSFMTILEHFKPVFRHFFFENFKEAGTFFERRLAYTRSVATNSMVGYILGLGDRHVLNILVDKSSAELIHIDLGVAFEQGRILPSPETIPFRLTRDIVDGMGVAGVEGVFRKSCEMTLEVLRNHSEIILTILEVLLYDPLYMWTLTADRMRKVQPTDSNRPILNRRSSTSITDTAEEAPKERNSSAARVLLRLRQKLVGVEEEGGASASALSVPGHVSLLIQRAMDPERLSRLFPGWQPYL